MRFVVEPEAMNGDDPVLSALDSILRRVELEVHELEITAADELEESRWYQGSRRRQRELLEKASQASAHHGLRKRGPHLRQIGVRDARTANDASDLAYTPLCVLVENEVSDGALVWAALKALAEPETRRLCFDVGAMQPPAFYIDSRGGSGELCKRLASCVDDAARYQRPLRMVVVTDSDGGFPGDVHPKAQEIRKACLDAGVPCPALQKRNAENYIPDPVWRSRMPSEPAIDALCRLSPQQRDHIKLGKMGETPWDSSKPDVAKLYASVPLEDYNLLKNASLKGRKDKMMILALDAHLPPLTREQLLSRDHHGDLEALVRIIEDEL